MKLIKNKIHEGREQKKERFCDTLKMQKSITWSINICPKDFVTHAKTLRPPPLLPCSLVYAPLDVFICFFLLSPAVCFCRFSSSAL